MRKRLFLSICVVLFTCILVYGINSGSVFASNHVHTSGCFVGHNHIANECKLGYRCCNGAPLVSSYDTRFGHSFYWNCSSCGKQIFKVQISHDSGSNVNIYSMEGPRYYYAVQNYYGAGIRAYSSNGTGDIRVRDLFNALYNYQYGIFYSGYYFSTITTYDQMYSLLPIFNENANVLDFWAGSIHTGIPTDHASDASYSCGIRTQDTTPICPAYTIAPTVSISNMSTSTVLSTANTSFYPQIYVYDNENDNLTCNYYIEGRADIAGTMSVTGTYPGKLVAFPNAINATRLAEGTYKIIFTATDNYAPPGITSVQFRVDLNPPVTTVEAKNNTSSSFRLDTTASDSISGVGAYRYTISGKQPTEWLTSTFASYTTTGLTPNTAYTYKVEARDYVGHVGTYNGNTYTKNDTSTVTASAMEGSGLQVVIKDNNPSGTLYRVQVGSQYSNALGVLSAAEVWSSLSYDASVAGKKITIPNTSPNSTYVIKVSSKNNYDASIVNSSNVTVTTAPAIPIGLNATAVANKDIYITWSSVPGAVGYELFRTTVTSTGTVIVTKSIPNILTSWFHDSDIVDNQYYRYAIRCKNGNNVFGNWSSNTNTVKAIPQLPPRVNGITAEIDGSVINLSWNSITNVLGYEVEISHNGIVLSNKKVVSNHLSYDTKLKYIQCDIRVRALNYYTGSNPADTSTWSNEGQWSLIKPFFTDPNVPVLDAIDLSLVTNNKIAITWDRNDNPVTVQYKVGLFAQETLIKEYPITGSDVGVTKLTYSITELVPETSYEIRLRAVNPNNSVCHWSNSVTATTLMDKPGILTGLKATAMSDRITLSWNKAERAKNYIVERNGSEIASVSATADPIISYIDMDVLPDTEYSYSVKASNISGNSEPSPPLIKKTLGSLPNTPVLMAITELDNSIKVEWSSLIEVSGYDIEVDGAVVNVGMATSYIHNGVTPNTNYTYRVRSRNINGKSDWSEYATLITSPVIPVVPVILPIEASETQLIIRWTEVPYAVSYDIEIDSVVYEGIPLSEYIYTVTGSTSIEHSICVRAMNSAGVSDWSTITTASLLPEGSGEFPVIPIPATPILLANVTTGSSIVAVSWSEVEGAARYQLEADNNIVYSGADIAFIHFANSSIEQHQYRIRAGNLSGFSEWSSPITVNTYIEDNAVPNNLSFYRIDDNNTAIIWNGLPNISGYRIEVNGVISMGDIAETMTSITTEPGSQYSIRIASVITNGDETQYNWSDEISFRAPNKLPGIVELTELKATSDSINVVWDMSPDAYGYEISINEQIVKVDNVTSYTISNLEATTSYLVKVRAYNEAGVGDWSKGKTITTNEGIPGVPINLVAETTATVGAVSGCAISLRWDSVEGATSYEIESSNGMSYTSVSNQKDINNLVPGVRYNYRVRAINEGGASAWSTRLSHVPTITEPLNVAAMVIDGVVRVSWDVVGGAEYYEIEFNGIAFATTESNSIDFPYSDFYMQRTIRVRACYATQKSEWSESKQFSQALPIDITVVEDEEFSVLLPAKNVDISKYKLTLVYDTDELQLLDACELTPEPERTTTYIDATDTYLIISHSGESESISFLIQDTSGNSWTGVASSIRFKSKITGTVTLKYGVTTK